MAELGRQVRTVPDARAVLRESVRGQRRGVVAAALMAVGHQLSEAAVPVVVGVALDRAVGTGDGSALALWLAVVAGVFVVLTSCGGIGYWFMDRARFRAERRPPRTRRRPGARPGRRRRRDVRASRSAWPAPTPTGRPSTSPRAPQIASSAGRADGR